MKVLVTGGAGFIGSHLAHALIARGDRVRILDDMSSGQSSNIAGLPAELMIGDVADRAVVDQAVADCDAVVHLAALVSVPQSIKEPERNHQINVNGTFNLFEAARAAGITRVVYASSAAIYGNVPDLPCRLDSRPAPVSPYGAAKFMGEQYAAAYNAAYGQSYIGMRFFNVFGPRQDPSSPYSGVLSIFCRAAVTQRPIKIFGDGLQTRDFIYVSDVIGALLKALELDHAAHAPMVYNIGRGEQTTILDVAHLLGDFSGRPLEITFEPARAGDIRYSVADVSAMTEHLDYRPTISVADGLAQTYEWFQQSYST